MPKKKRENKNDYEKIGNNQNQNKAARPNAKWFIVKSIFERIFFFVPIQFAQLLLFVLFFRIRQ